MLQIQIQQVRREVKDEVIAGMSKEELVLLTFAEKEKHTQLDWEHATEFEYKGKMYDVVETKSIGDTTYYWVWCDDKETTLNQKINQLVYLALGSNPKNQENQKRLHHFFKSLYCSNAETTEFIARLNLENKCHFQPSFYSPIAQAPLVPPPKKS